MRTRLLAGALWLLAVWTMYEVAAFFLGAPRAVGPVLAVVAAAVVTLDPAGWLWTRTGVAASERSVR